MKRKIYVVGGDVGYANWMQGELVDRMDKADLVVFTGGEDVTPSYYGEPAHPTTQNNPYRDNYELGAFVSATGKKLIGICRGSQFLCVMAGGKLVQDQQPQSYYHMMHRIDFDHSIKVTSTHHQAQWPWNLPKDEFKLIGWTDGLSSWHEDGSGKEIVRSQDISEDGPGDRPEVEVCFYPIINALAIQSHPEHYFGSKDPELRASIEYFQDLLNRHMEGRL